MTIAGASQYRIQATAQLSGVAVADTGNVLGASGSVTSILDAGRATAISGLGLSSNARALNNSFLSSTADTFNSIFSLTGGTDGTVDGNQQAILALRASLPENQIASSLRGENVDEEV